MRKELAPGLVLTLVACQAPAPPPAGRAGARNVLLITVDTLRADHLGTYGYPRATSPRLDALGREGTVFERAYTFWPKTRASMVMMLTGRRPSQNGYDTDHRVLFGFNPTLASLLGEAGYATAAVVDNPNVGANFGYAKGFESYQEVWDQPGVESEMDAARVITASAIRFLRDPPKARPVLLWLHYVNPHAPYTPPAPNDAAFLDREIENEPPLRVVPGFRGGIPEPLFVQGQNRLGYYVAQYDGEVATVDQEVGQVLDALRSSAARDRTVVLVTADHGESLGEHRYYFDHGEDLFDPCLHVPLLLILPDGKRGLRSDVLASTLDVVPTLLEAVQVPRPAELAGESLLGVAQGVTAGLRRERICAQNDRGATACLDGRFKLVIAPPRKKRPDALYDRVTDPAESRDVATDHPREARVLRQEADFFLARAKRERAAIQPLVLRPPHNEHIDPAMCERLRALGYVQNCASN